MRYKKEKTSELTNLTQELKKTRYRFSLNENLFYHSKPVFDILEKKDYLQVEIAKNDFSKLYLSYHTLNNKFDEPPENSLLNLNEYKKFQFIIEIDKEDSVDVIPYIIHYKKGKKRRLTSINKIKKIINFQKDDKCRLTFKVIGNGTFNIKEIIIIPKG